MQNAKKDSLNNEKVEKWTPKIDFKRWEEVVGTSGRRKATWVVVDVNNEFTYLGMKHKISDSVEQYAVHNKPYRLENGEWNDWTNEAEMTHVLVVDNNKYLSFYDEKLNEIDPELVKLLR